MSLVTKICTSDGRNPALNAAARASAGPRAVLTGPPGKCFSFSLTVFKRGCMLEHALYSPHGL